MDESGYPTGGNLSFKQKFVNFIEDIWPSIYKVINAFFFGFLQFLKYLLEGLWPRK